MEKPYTITGAADVIRQNTDKIDTLINAAGCVMAGPIENMQISKSAGSLRLIHFLIWISARIYYPFWRTGRLLI